MSANESPATNGAPAKISIDHHRVDSTPAPLTPARQIAVWTDGLLDGTVSLAELPTPVAQLYLLGHVHGAQSRADEVFRLHVENDLLHWRAYNPGKTAADYRRAQTDALWAEGVAA